MIRTRVEYQLSLDGTAERKVEVCNDEGVQQALMIRDHDAGLVAVWQMFCSLL